MTQQERIKADAQRYTKDEGYQKAYIAGATAEHERAQLIVDALQELVDLKHMKDEGVNVREYLERKPAAWAKAIIVLQQWKGAGKEVGDGKE